MAKTNKICKAFLIYYNPINKILNFNNLNFSNNLNNNNIQLLINNNFNKHQPAKLPTYYNSNSNNLSNNNWCNNNKTKPNVYILNDNFIF